MMLIDEQSIEDGRLISFAIVFILQTVNNLIGKLRCIRNTGFH